MSRLASTLADQALTRAAGAPLVDGNAVRLLRDATENYPAWLEAIGRARRWIHFESYVVHDDGVGREFVSALAERARAGVRVRLVYDWLGSLWNSPFLFRELKSAGGEVRCFNRPGFSGPFDWITRDHRKMLAVDGQAAFVSGLCIGQMWVGDPERGLEPWRDAGVEVMGPAVADVERGFADTWRRCGEALPADEIPDPSSIAIAGDIALRVIATVPGQAPMFRLDQLIAAAARETLWLTDAYFAGTTAYVHALCTAARDGVDVRLLVPGGSDIPILRPISQAGYRPLLEAGVRVFEWNGTMLHAKTAVADRRWARVGSTNLNVASWLGNLELDVAVEDERFAEQMTREYVEDLARSTEIVLARRRIRRSVVPERSAGGKAYRGNARRAAAGALRLGNTLGAAFVGRRLLGASESGYLALLGLLLLAVASVGFTWPRAITVPIVVLAAWQGAVLLVRALRMRTSDRTATGRDVDAKA